MDPSRRTLPVVPAAHYHMGGVATDSHGRTSLSGLWAVGEVACTGAHGANRLASNSLLECLVFGARAAAAIRGETALRAVTRAPRVGSIPTGQGPSILPEVRRLMTVGAGVVRDEEGLERALETLARLEPRCREAGAGERAAWTVARLICRAALLRRESRGSHRRQDFPRSTPGSPERLVLRQTAEGEIVHQRLPLVDADRRERQ
jgi:L-aspartate oxidase